MTYTFENVAAWQKAHTFVLNVYSVTKQFPADELYGLTSQFRRAAVSITFMMHLRMQVKYCICIVMV